MTTGSMRLGTYAGIPVRAHWSMALVAALFGTGAAVSWFGLRPGPQVVDLADEDLP